MDFLTQYYIPIVLVACLVVGYLMKQFMPTDNKWIPLTVTILGAVLGCIASKGISLEAVVAGAVTGLASTGLHQLFKQLIDGGGKEEADEE
jgi:hypothetical protein